MCSCEYCSVLSSDHEHFCLVLGGSAQEKAVFQPLENIFGTGADFAHPDILS